jgi:hypothetical protein
MRRVLEHQSPGGPQLTRVRGSLIASSLQALRELGYFERYRALLPDARREAVLHCAPNSWVAVDLAQVHYEACDALALSEPTTRAVGEAVSQRIMGAFLGTMMRSGRAVDALPSPWIPLKQYGRIVDRLLDGGSHVVTELGPKAALIESSGLSLLRIWYVRTAMLGITSGVAGLFAKSCTTSELPGADPEQIRISLHWV